MESEHLTNLHPLWALTGWAIAIAATSGVYLGAVGTGLVTPGAGEIAWVGIAMAAGFFAGGLFVGAQWSQAPVIHGAAITLFSVLAWFIGALLVPGTFSDIVAPTPWILGLVLVQLVASVGGGWTGRRMRLGTGKASVQGGRSG